MAVMVSRDQDLTIHQLQRCTYPASRPPHDTFSRSPLFPALREWQFCLKAEGLLCIMESLKKSDESYDGQQQYQPWC